MKNVTISLDDEVYRTARIRAAERGTSLSAMVKDYLNGLADQSLMTGVREMQTTYTAPLPLAPGVHGVSANGKPYFTPDSKPRQPGAMRGMGGWSADFDAWPDGFIDALSGEDTPASNSWWIDANDRLPPAASE